MARPTQIRRIFAELRRALGPEVPAWELLQLANHILEAHLDPEIGEFEEPAVRRPFFALEVDTAFDRDGGFAVLKFEQQQGMAFDDDLPENGRRTEVRLRGLIGRTAWPRTNMD